MEIRHFLFLIILVTACKSDGKLPIYGNVEISEQDTVYHSIPDFSFINQDSLIVRKADFSDYIYVADFFFTSCPSICPKVKKQMLRIYDEYQSESILKLVSHTIDPKRDTPEALKIYAKNLDVNTDKWMFLTGEKSELLDMADEYFVVAFEDADAPGGFDHSGKILLVDKKGHIRAFCEGTDPDDVSEFIKDIQSLIDEYNS